MMDTSAVDFAGTINLIDHMAVAVFAVTGALVASRRQLDIFGFIVLGTATGIGGGSIRDILLGQLPVFWVHQSSYLIVCAVISAVTFFTSHLLNSRFRAILWLDALGLSLFCVLGTEKALAAGTNMIVAVLMGVISATFGGIVRDVLSAERPLILGREIYMTAALIGALAYGLALSLGLNNTLGAAIGMGCAFATRAGGLKLGWSLPVYKARPPRPRP